MPLQISADRLYDFEATLRLVDNALDELQVLAIDTTDSGKKYTADRSGCGAPATSRTPLRAYREVQEGLHSLRHGRAVLERTGRASHSTEPVSTSDALLALDRALTTVTGVEAAGRTNTAEAFEAVREEIRSAMECLRGRDVTDQQLTYAAGILLDMDNRLVQLADILDPYGDPPGAEG